MDPRTPTQRAADIRRVIVATEKAIARHGGVRAAARALGVAASHICDLRKGRREPGIAVAVALGLRKIVRWEKVHE